MDLLLPLLMMAALGFFVGAMFGHDRAWKARAKIADEQAARDKKWADILRSKLSRIQEITDE